jgi:microcystin-dependent protein
MRRRTFLLSAVAVLGAAGCGSPPPPAGSTSPPAPAAGSADGPPAPAPVSPGPNVGTSSPSAGFVAGELISMATDYAPTGTLDCTGGTAMVADHPDLFRAIGSTFGGDGRTTFGLPTIAARDSGGVPVRWVVGAVDQPVPAQPLLGEIRPFLVDPDPAAWLPCDGTLLPADRYPPLAALLGSTFGGDGTSTVGLPKLPALAAGGARPAGWFIAATGIFPSTSCDARTPTFPATTLAGRYLSSVVQVGYAPVSVETLCGVALCGGQALPVRNEWNPLFGAIGNRFGGEPDQTFRLPTLTGPGRTSLTIVTSGVYPGRD